MKEGQLVSCLLMDSQRYFQGEFMADANQFMGKVFVGNPVNVGPLRDRLSNMLMEGEDVEMEFKGIRDGMLFTTIRVLVVNSQGITGKKLEVSSFPWRNITAFSLENSGTFDLEAELKFCGSGWGVCEVVLTKGTNVSNVCQFINDKLFNSYAR